MLPSALNQPSLSKFSPLLPMCNLPTIQNPYTQNPNHKKLNKKTNQFSKKRFRFSNLLKISLRIIFRFNFDNLTKMINKLQLPSVLLVYFLHYKDNKTKQESHKMIVDKNKNAQQLSINYSQNFEQFRIRKRCIFVYVLVRGRELLVLSSSNLIHS